MQNGKNLKISLLSSFYKNVHFTYCGFVVGKLPHDNYFMKSKHKTNQWLCNLQLKNIFIICLVFINLKVKRGLKVKGFVSKTWI